MNGVEIEENRKIKCMEISIELKSEIENRQLQLQNAIRNHQILTDKKRNELADGADQLETDIQEAKHKILHIGTKQKHLITRLKEEYHAYQKTSSTTSAKGGRKDRPHVASYTFNRARKQNLLPCKPSSPIQTYENEPENRNSPPSPLSILEENGPVNPEDMDQSAFLSYFRLATHETFTEMQRKRAERKRRSTANPQFVYGNKGWDFLGPPVKRKRSTFLAHPPSPPNTRGRKRQETVKQPGSRSPPVATNGNHSDKLNNRVGGFIPILPATFTSLKNLPPGLVIEPISSPSSPDSLRCIICKQPGALSLCEHCTNGFHMSCHNRPFSRTPKQCPKCLRARIKEDRLLVCSSSTSTSCSSAMSIDFNSSPTEISEKLQLKQECQEKHFELVAQLTQLQNRHSELTVVLKNQAEDKQRLTKIQKTTESKIDELIKFIETVKRISVPEQS